jgi:hypothetical protein
MTLIEEAIASVIDAAGIVDSSSTPATVLIGIEPDGINTPDFTITIVPESGLPPTRRISIFFGFSVFVRHPKGLEAQKVVAELFDLLQEYQGRPLSVPIARITANAGPVQLGRDGNGGQGRWRVSQSYTAIVRNPNP